MNIMRILSCAWIFGATALMAAGPSPDYPFQPVPFTVVHLTDSFWAPRIETNRLATIPYAFGKCEETGRMDNFIRAAAVLRGESLSDTNLPGFPFDDTDVYKILEGASYVLATQPDANLRAYLDKLIAEIGAAQEPDLLNGVKTIKAGSLKAIPYYAWANRGKGEMEVWITRATQ
jgi:DUF1680 family protein